MTLMFYKPKTKTAKPIFIAKSEFDLKVITL